MSRRERKAFLAAAAVSSLSWIPIRTMFMMLRGCEAVGSEIMLPVIFFAMLWKSLDAYAVREDMKERRRKMIMARVRKERRQRVAAERN